MRWHDWMLAMVLVSMWVCIILFVAGMFNL